MLKKYISPAPYMPKKEKDLLAWIDQFFNSLKPLLPLLKIEESDYENYLDRFGIIKDAYSCHIHLESYGTALTEYKNQLLYAPTIVPVPAPRQEERLFPEALSGSGGLIGDLITLAKQIKLNPVYNDDIGKQLGIIPSASTTPDWDHLAAVLSVENLGNEVLVKWTKGSADSLRLEVNRGDGWQLLDVCDSSPYRDKTPQPAQATSWKYRGQYRHGGNPVGGPGPEASVLVQAK